MAIVISRTGDLTPQTMAITQEQRDALWAAFVTHWVDNHQDEVREILTKTETKSA